MLGPTVTYFPRIYTGSARSPVRTERSFFTGAHATVRYKTKSLPSRSAKEQPFITSTAQMASRTSMCGRSTRSARRSADIHLVDRSLRAISEIRDSVNPLTSHSTLVARLTALGVRFRSGGRRSHLGPPQVSQRTTNHDRQGACAQGSCVDRTGCPSREGCVASVNVLAWNYQSHRGGSGGQAPAPDGTGRGPMRP